MHTIVLWVVSLILTGCSFAQAPEAYDITRYINTTADNRVWDVTVDHDHVWCLTSPALVRWNPMDSTYTSFPLPEPAYHGNISMATGSDGRVWILHGLGYWQHNFFIFKNGEFSGYDFEDTMDVGIGDMVCDESGAAWFATNNGVFRFENETWERFGIDDGLPAESISSIGIDGDGTVWCGTSSPGFLARYDGMWHTHDIGLGADGGVKLMAVDRDGGLWLVVYTSNESDNTIVYY